MNRYRKLFSNTVILAMGTFGSKLLVFLLMPLYTAILSTEQYGTVELITSISNLLIPIACLGITSGVFRFAADRGADERKVFSSGLALLGLGSLAFLVFSPLLGLVNLFSENLVLIVLYVLFANLQGICAQFVRAKDLTRLFAVQGILNTLLTVLFNLLFLLVFKMGTSGYILAVIAGNCVTAVFLVIRAKLFREFSFSSVDKSFMKEMLKFSAPLIPATICWLLTDLSDRYMVSFYCGVAENGIYSAAYKIPTIVTLISGVFMQAWQFSAVVEAGGREKIKAFYNRVFEGLISIVFIGTAILILMSELLTKLLLNVTYWDAAKFMPILLCAAAAESLVSFLATVYLVRKKSLNSFLTALLGTGINIILNAALIVRKGAVSGALGAAVATLCAYLAVLVIRCADVPRWIQFKLHLPRLAIGMALLIGEAIAVTFFEIPTLQWGLSLILIGINFKPFSDVLKGLYLTVFQNQAKSE